MSNCIKKQKPNKMECEKKISSRSTAVADLARRRIIIGITGVFGSGKTTVAGLFKAYGAEVIDADKLAHEAIAAGKPVYRRIVAIFGKVILDKNKRIARKTLARIVFNDKKLLEKLNRIIHPVVIRQIKEKIKSSRKAFIVLDVPLLIETGLSHIVDKVVVVKINRDGQIKRLRRKFGFSEKEILQRIHMQAPLSAKLRLADFIIDNNAGKNDTKKQVKNVWRRLN